MQVTPWHAAALALTMLPAAAAAQGDAGPINWTSYIDSGYAFSVDLPLGLFEPIGDDNGLGMTLSETGGGGQLSIYGGEAEGLTLDQFAERLSSGEQVRTITYKASGNSWFVLSGDYAPDAVSSDPLIFYTKVLLSPDGNSFSAFEISYPKSEKARFDPIVDRIEGSITRPGTAK